MNTGLNSFLKALDRLYSKSHTIFIEQYIMVEFQTVMTQWI